MSVATGLAVARGQALPRRAGRDVRSHIRLWLVTAVGLAVDLWTKQAAFDALVPGQTRPIVDGWLSLQLSLNPGALFGMGRSLAPIFVGASVLALMFVLYLFAHSAARQRWMHVVLGCVLAGALGNLYDRTMLSGFIWQAGDGVGVRVGKFISQNEHSVRIGDYQTGRNPMWYPLGPDVRTGSRPVVRDFIHIDATVAGRSVWPWVFNIADALLVVGVAGLLIHFLWEGRDEARAQA